MQSLVRRLAITVLALTAVLAASMTPATAARVHDPASPTILLTGSNRGIGLALATEYAAQGWNVIATCRTPKEATELKALAAKHPKVIIEQLDVTDTRQIRKLAAKYRDQPIDVLFNNAGWLGTPIENQQFGNFDQALFNDVMNTNAFAPLRMAEAFAANVESSQQKKIVSVTSGLGSLTLMGRMSRFYYYQMSKASMNMGMRALRNDLMGRGVIVALLAPGMVETDLLEASGYSGKALKPAESAAALYKLVAALTIQDPGVPVNVDGKPIPW